MGMTGRFPTKEGIPRYGSDRKPERKTRMMLRGVSRPALYFFGKHDMETTEKNGTHGYKWRFQCAHHRRIHDGFFSAMAWGWVGNLVLSWWVTNTPGLSPHPQGFDFLGFLKQIPGLKPCCSWGSCEIFFPHLFDVFIIVELNSENWGTNLVLLDSPKAMDWYDPGSPGSQAIKLILLPFWMSVISTFQWWKHKGRELQVFATHLFFQ